MKKPQFNKSALLLFSIIFIFIAYLSASSSTFRNFGTKIAITNRIIEMFFFKQNADTIIGSARITAVWNDAQQIKVKLQITQYRDESLKLSLYNLLGKEVKTIYEGLPRDNDYEYTASISDLPNGVYICILSSNNYKDAKKLVISR